MLHNGHSSTKIEPIADRAPGLSTLMAGPRPAKILVGENENTHLLFLQSLPVPWTCKAMNSDDTESDRYRALFEKSADAMLIIKGDRFVDCNQAAVDMLRFADKQSLLQCHPSKISPVYQPDGKRSFDKANEILALSREAGNQRFEWVHRRSDGEEFPVEVLLTEIVADGEPMLHIAWRELSEQKELEKQVRHAQKMNVLGNLTSGIAHDFNNTLAPIITYSGLLADVLKDHSEWRHWALEINRAGALAASLIRKLLSVSRKDRGQLVRLDLTESIRSTLPLAQKLVGEDVALKYTGPDTPLWIQTEIGNVELVLLNLASNSRDAMPNGGRIDLSVTVTQENQAKVSFSDTGSGMSSETQEKAFEPFFTTKAAGAGTGLGLASVCKIMREAGGSVQIDSELDRGTTIDLLFPLNDPGEVVMVSTGDNLIDQRRQTLRGTQILVVEDDPRIRNLITGILETEEMLVVSTGDGVEALAKVQDRSFDLVLSDIIMPEMNGPAFADKARTMGCDVPVVYLTGYTDDRLRFHHIDPEACAPIRKPFSANELLDRLYVELVKQTNH